MESLIYFLIWGAAIFLMMRFGCGAHVMGHGREQSHPASPPDGHDATHADAQVVPPGKKAMDPVCRMIVETAKAKSCVYRGRAYYFCSAACRGQFEANPNAFALADGASPDSKEHHHAH